MKPCKLIYFFCVFLFFIYFDGFVYGCDLSLKGNEEENIKNYSFAFINNFQGNEALSSDVVVVIAEQKEHEEKGDRKIIKVAYQENLILSLPYNRIRVNVFISPPRTKVSPRKEYTDQEFLEKYGRLPSPRKIIKERSYDLPEGFFVTYKDIRLPYSIDFTQE